MRNLLCIVVFSCLALCQQAPAQVLTCQYLPGLHGLKSAELPPPGFTFVNNTVFFSGNEFVDGAGNSIPLDGELFQVVNVFAFAWASEKDFLFGGRYNALLTVPIGNLAPNPSVPGVQAGTAALSDMLFVPFGLGWKKDGEWSLLAQYGVFAPTGRFTAGATDNTGKGFWNHNLIAAGTYYFGEDRSWHASLMGRYQFPMKQQQTGIQPGNQIVLEYGVGKTFKNNLNVGLVGFYYRQVTSQKNSPPGTDTTRFYSVGLGGEVSYVFPSAPVNLKLRVTEDLDVRNLVPGTGTVLSVNVFF